MRRYVSLIVLLSILMHVSTAVAQNNILNNGGFEYGLMCYSNWVWSQTGQIYKGDYRFLLSRDAHTGPYSLEIRCDGPDCLKAAIFLNKIPTPPGQSYSLSFYAKCFTGREAVFYVPNTSSGNLFEYLTCNGNWVRHSYTFRVGPTAADFYFYV